MLATLNLRFTKASDPLVIELECDDTECLFVISTNHAPSGFPIPSQQSRQPSVSTGRKRQREEDEGTPEPTPKALENAVIRRKPMKVVQKQNVQMIAKSLASESQRSSRSMPPPSLPLYSEQELEYTQDLPPEAEPLFLPGSQMSVEEEALIRSTGLGIENMTAEEITEMLEGEGEEYAMPPTQRSEMDDFALFDDTEMEPTQTGDASKVNCLFSRFYVELRFMQAFQPLFED
jgi:cell cycle checkpoint control protein RAD9A